MKDSQSLWFTGVGPAVYTADKDAQFWTVSPIATGLPALSGLMIRPLIVGGVLEVMPGCDCPNSQRMRVTYSPAPRPGGGDVRVVCVAVFGELPHSVHTHRAGFFA